MNPSAFNVHVCVFVLLLALLPAGLAQEANGQEPEADAVPVQARVDSGESTIGSSYERRAVPRDSVEIPIGYGLTRSPDELTSAVAFARSWEIDGRSLLNPANALYGKLLGLTVLQNGGTRPSDPTMFVRGRSTLGGPGRSAPLVLIDGFQRPLSSLSPGEIESLSVLKDAASLAMYGQRGAHGVVLVNTRRGSAGNLRVSASFEQSLMQPTKLPEFVEGPAYGRALNEALANDGQASRYSDADLRGFAQGNSAFYPNVDWFDRVLRDYGRQSSFNMTFEGGGNTARYFALIDYAGDRGLFGPVDRNDGYSTQLKHDQFNFRGNLDVSLTDRLLLKANAGGQLKNKNVPSGGGGDAQLFDALYSTPSAAFPVRTPSGSFGGTQRYGNNPVALLTSTGYGSPNRREVFGDVSLRQDLSQWVRGLSAEATVSYNNWSVFYEQKAQNYSYEALAPVRNERGTIVDTVATQYGQDTDLNFLSSFGQQRTQSNFVAKLHYDRTFGSNTVQATVLGHQDTRVLDGQDNVFHRRNFAANVHYGRSGKYFLNAAASYNGNNILPEGDRYGLFPAVSAAWLASKEGFLKGADFLNRLKLRASWGMSGSDRLPTNNLYEQSYQNVPGYWFQDRNNFMSGFNETRLPSSDFTYETAYNTNFGLDAQLFDKLTLTANLFYTRQTDILTGTGGEVSQVIGIDPPQESEGVVDNRGVEVAMNWKHALGDFRYRIGGQFSMARNKIVEMNETFRPHDYLKRTGKAVGQRFGLEAVGFFEDEEDIADSPRQAFSEVQPGDIKYKDQNGDGIVNEFDEVPIGHASGYPEMTFAASVDLNYKGLGVSALMQGVGNYTAYLNTQSVFRPLQNDNTISEYYFNRRWTPETAGEATLPRLTTESNANNYQPNTTWLVDRSYAKLRSLTLSYRLPRSLIQGWTLENVQLYAQGRNLFSIDSVPVLDPEHMSATYPIMRSYSLGVRLSF